MRRLVLIVDVDLRDDEIGEDLCPSVGEYPHLFAGFVVNEVNNTNDMPGRVTGLTARWTEYDTSDADA